MSDFGSAPAVPALAGDLLRGVEEISAFLGQDKRRVYNLCRRGELPVGKQGMLYIGSRQVLREHYAKLVSGQL